MKIVPYYDRAEFIERMLTTVGVNLAEGAALVIAVLFLMLGSLRGSLLAALAIPLSMGVAVIGMRQFGVTGNLMSLGAIDFGLLVDGAIVMLEGTLHALDKQRPPPDEVPAAVARAMSAAAKPVAFAVGIIMLVYLPLMALEGVEGKMFRPMAITVAMALAGALLFTLTTFPAACAYALRAPKARAHERRGLMARLTDRYAALLGGALRRPALVLAVAGLALGAAIPFAGSLGAEFVPRLEEGEFSLDVRRLPSIGISTAKDLSIQVEEVAARFPEALSVVTRLGRAEVATDPVGVDEAQVRIKLRPPKEWTTAKDMDALGAIMKDGDRAGGSGDVRRDLAADRGSREPAAFGLARGSGDQGVRAGPGDAARDRQPDRGDPADGARDRRPARAARAGVAAARRARSTACGWRATGSRPPRCWRRWRRRAPGSWRARCSRTRGGSTSRCCSRRRAAEPESIGEVPVGTKNGAMVPLAQLASIQTREGPATISREALERRLLVEANVRGRDLVSYVGESRARVEARGASCRRDTSWCGRASSRTSRARRTAC